LLEQINTCIHWINAKSQLKRALTNASDPTTVVKGRQPIAGADGSVKMPDLVIGVDAVIDIPVEGDAKYLELEGKSLVEQREEVNAKQDDMDKYKASIQEKDASISTKQIGIENSDKISQLTSWSLSASIWLTNTVKIAAEYMGIVWDGKVTVNMDFDEFKLDADKMEKLSQQELRGQLSLQTFLEIEKEGEVLPEWVDVEDEIAKIGNRNPTI
jgi:hypothetical protein